MQSLTVPNVNQYRFITEYSEDIISFTTPEGVFRYVSPAFERLLGHSCADVIGHYSFQDFLHPDDVLKYQPVAERDNHHQLLRMRHLQGHYLWVQTSTYCIRGDQGEVVECFSMTRDVTESIQTEIALTETKNDLAYAQRVANIGSWIWDLEHDVRVWSEEAYRILGIEDMPLTVKESAVLLGRIHPDDQQFYTEHIERALANGSLDIEARIIHGKTSEERVIVIRAEVVFSESGTPVKMVGTIRDISEQKSIEKHMRETEKLSIAGQLAAGIAHEIRNPLTSLKGFIQLMQKSAADDKQNNYLQIMHDEMARIEYIVNEMLVLAKPQKEEVRLIDVKVDVQKVIWILTSEALLRGIDVDLAEGEPLPPILGVQYQLQQVVINLLKNAFDAMPRGGSVHVCLERQPGHVVVRVIDHGVGMSPEQLQKLGEPFYTTKATGTGLGLMVTREIVNRHNGKIEFQSQPGQGTTVSVILPTTE